MEVKEIDENMIDQRRPPRIGCGQPSPWLDQLRLLLIDGHGQARPGFARTIFTLKQEAKMSKLIKSSSRRRMSQWRKDFVQAGGNPRADTPAFISWLKANRPDQLYRLFSEEELQEIMALS